MILYIMHALGFPKTSKIFKTFFDPSEYISEN